MSDCGCHDEVDKLERRTLKTLLGINAFMFVAEAVTGWIGESTGLMADSLDMLADAFVYGIALFAVGRSPMLQTKAARSSGVMQITLGLCVIAEVIRRYLFGSEPVSVLIIAVGTAAFVANAACLVLIFKHRHGGAHMRASWIFSTNDVIANLGVVVSGLLVWLTGSRLPDLIIGAVVSLLVIRGGARILRDSRAAPESATQG